MIWIMGLFSRCTMYSRWGEFSCKRLFLLYIVLLFGRRSLAMHIPGKYRLRSNSYEDVLLEEDNADKPCCWGISLIHNGSGKIILTRTTERS